MNASLLVLALLLFASGVSLVVGTTVASHVGRRAAGRRLDLVALQTNVLQPAGKGAARWTSAANAFAHRMFGFGMSGQWGTRSATIVLAALALAGATGGWLLVHVLLKAPDWLAAATMAAAFMLAPRMLLSLEQSKAEARFVDRFPDAIDMIVRMLRAGLPVTAAIRTVGTEGAPPVDTVFCAIADKVDIGVPLVEALNVAAAEVRQADFRFFAVAVAMQHSTGGNLTTTLEILSEIVRKRRATRLKARAVTAEVRMTAYILGAIPFVIVAALLAFSPGYLAPLVEDPRGNLIAAAAIGSLTVGFLTMRQMMRTATRL